MLHELYNKKNNDLLKNFGVRKTINYTIVDSFDNLRSVDKNEIFFFPLLKISKCSNVIVNIDNLYCTIFSNKKNIVSNVSLKTKYVLRKLHRLENTLR